MTPSSTSGKAGVLVDSSVVTEGKFLPFLSDGVEPRGGKKSLTSEAQPLPNDGIEGNAKVIVDLYKIQLTLQLNDRPHPCGKTLKEFLRSRKRETNQLKRDAFIDRGIGTVLDTHDADRMINLSCYFLSIGKGPSLRSGGGGQRCSSGAGCGNKSRVFQRDTADADDTDLCAEIAALR